MAASVAELRRLSPGMPAASAVAALFVHERDRDERGVAMPRPSIQLVARFGSSTRGGLDIHALGVRERVYRKLLPRGQRAVTARLHLGVTKAVLGVPASELAGRVVALEDLWGDAPARRLLELMAGARDTSAAAAILEHAIAQRLALAPGRSDSEQLAIDATNKLTKLSVSAVARDLGVSERNLRRIFRETIGVSPKTFARLARFERAVHASRLDRRANWAAIASAVGYYDQAHLIAEFRAIAGVTPRAFLGELLAAPSFGG